jgi:hypothetical protein
VSTPAFPRLPLLALGAVLMASAGCATVAHGRTQTVVVTSDPSGARVFLKSTAVGLTPVQLQLKRRDEHIVLRIEKDGFVPADIPLKRTVSGWVSGNLAFANPLMIQGLNSASEYPLMAAQGLAFGFGTDFLTGAAYKLPKVVRVTLTPVVQSPPQQQK